LVENLRTFSRLDEAEYKATDLRECLESTVAVLESAVRNRVDIVLDLPSLPPVPCFAAQLSQVFMNLLLNASQAIVGPGQITITGREAESEIVLTFTDSGPGIPADVLPKIFNPFFTTKDVGSGTGLGLYLSYKIIADQHRGRISAESGPGQGATFTVVLPKGSVAK
jgi:signal transduction histidine kinase